MEKFVLTQVEREVSFASYLSIIFAGNLLFLELYQ